MQITLLKNEDLNDRIDTRLRKYTDTLKYIWHFLNKSWNTFTVLNSMEQGPYWEADSRSVKQEILSFIESESSLLCPQEPATGLCLERDDSSPHPDTVYLRSILILSAKWRQSHP
jgi:hypothetical protein